MHENYDNLFEVDGAPGVGWGEGEGRGVELLLAWTLWGVGFPLH